MSRPIYWDYLKLDQLLSLQDGLGDGPMRADELHFIVVHQTFELWFKLVLAELRLGRDHLAAPVVAEEKVPHVVHHLHRVNEIFKLCVSQFQVMETLPPQDFLAFRDKLTPASGFQSFQMREMEILLGLEDAQRVTYGGIRPLEHIKQEGGYAAARVHQAEAEPTLRAAVLAWLYRTPIQGSHPSDPGDAEVVESFIVDYLARVDAHGQDGLERLVVAFGEGERARLAERVAQTRASTEAFLRDPDPVARRARAGLLFIESYRELPLLAWPRLLLDTVVEMEEQLVLFRHRHARMVERVIGRRVGTGGSAGVEYLDKTVAYRIFPELWSVRSALLPADRIPPLQHRDRYGVE